MGAITFGRDKLKGSTKTPGDFNLSSHFGLEIDGIITNGVHKVEGLEVENETVTYRDGEDRDTHFRPGIRKPNRVKITKDWSSTNEFYNWYKTVKEGKTERKSISVVLHNDAGEEAMRINLFNCYPTKWYGPTFDSKTSAHATEAIDVLFETIEWKKG